MRAHVWSIPCLFALGALSACSPNVSGATPAGSGGAGGGTETTGAGDGGSGTSTGAGTGGSGTSTGAGAGGSGASTGAGGLAECPDQTLTAGACLVPAGGFPGEPPATLDLNLVATVTEIGEGAPPFNCWESPVKVLNAGNEPGQVWARLEDDTMQEWVVTVVVPTLQAGFNGHIVVGDTVNVSLSWSLMPGEMGFGYVVAELSVSRDDVLVAYVSEKKAPSWFTKDQTACQRADECCATTAFDAKAEVNGATGVVPNEGTAEVGGLAISNLGLEEHADLGCCNFDSEEPFLYLAAAAVPAP
jgi:hypothetical protein